MWRLHSLDLRANDVQIMNIPTYIKWIRLLCLTMDESNQFTAKLEFKVPMDLLEGQNSTVHSEMGVWPMKHPSH